MKPNAARWTIAALTVGVIVLVVVGGPPLWRWATTQRVYDWGWWYEGTVCHSTISAIDQPRFGDLRRADLSRVDHYWKNGFLAFEAEIEDGRVVRSTRWAPSGAIVEQFSELDSTGAPLPPGSRRKKSPPWRWGVEPQTRATAPWWDPERNQAAWWPDPES